MRERIALLAAFISCLSIFAPLRVFADIDAPAVPGELIVGFHEGASRARGFAGGPHGAEIVRRSTLVPAALVRIAPGEDVHAACEELLRRPEVAFAHPNYTGRAGFIPNDSQIFSQWHHNNGGQSGGTSGADIGSRFAWDLGRGSASITVAVLDTGIDSDHPEFSGRLLPGHDFVNGDSDPEDDHGHGTQVAGLLAANADNSFGVAGVDHFCQILPLKVLDDQGNGTTFDLIAALDWSRTQGVDVINMSLINYPLSGGLDAALQAADAAGITLVASAGNNGIGDADISAPGVSAYTISVGATDDSDQRAAFSATGQALDLVAPGANVETVVFDSAANASSAFTGTSAAAPIVAGMVSVMKALDPSLTNAEIRQHLQDAAQDQVGLPAEDAAGWDEYHGSGRVNLLASLEAVLGAVDAPVATVPDLALRLSPNPTRSESVLRFRIPQPQRVEASVYDISGRRVRSLLAGPRPAGTQSVVWDGRDDRDRPLRPGVYFVRVASGAVSHACKVTLLP
ncbi:MAG: S8 family serine peptidase [Gemmatimonadetes bacterium]|nr:S8 family serine peptidase [Gemmatimonadota bacterium]